MSNLCEDCPLRGDCVGEIEAIAGTDYQSMDMSGFRTKYRYSNLGKFIDEFDNQSGLFEGVDAETALERVDTCDGPVGREEKSFFGKVYTYNICGGLGVSATFNPDKEDMWQRAVFPPPPLTTEEKREMYTSEIRYKKVTLVLADLLMIGMAIWASKETRSPDPLISIGTGMVVVNGFTIRTIRRRRNSLEDLEEQS